ncbi:hypothetical protein Bca4012_082870 [Brassica carinata]
MGSFKSAFIVLLVLTASTTALKVEVPHVLTFLMLPRELIFSCLACVPKLFYPTLTLVSKSFRSFIKSPELYKTRLLLACTESCFMFAFGSNMNGTHTGSLYIGNHIKSKTHGCVLLLAFLMEKIYVASGGGLEKLDYTNWMELFDTKTQTWEFMPSPGKEIGESFDYENVALEGSIYVMLMLGVFKARKANVVV